MCTLGKSKVDSKNLPYIAISRFKVPLDLVQCQEQGPGNSQALPVIRYSAGVASWPKEEI